MELRFSSGTPGDLLHLHFISGSTRLLVLDHQLGLCGISLTHPPVLQLPSYLKQRSYVDIRLLHLQHLGGIWIGQDQYRLPLAPLNEFTEPWC